MKVYFRKLWWLYLGHYTICMEPRSTEKSDRLKSQIDRKADSPQKIIYL